MVSPRAIPAGEAGRFRHTVGEVLSCRNPWRICYTLSSALRDRLTVGRLALDQLVQVRILVPQPLHHCFCGVVSGFPGKRALETGNRRLLGRRHRLVWSRTPGSQPGNWGSNPHGATILPRNELRGIR